jgi:hypothetical protein
MSSGGWGERSCMGGGQEGQQATTNNVESMYKLCLTLIKSFVELIIHLGSSSRV